MALNLENVKAITLREYGRTNPADIGVFLDIAIQLAGILGQIHRNGGMHGYFKPEGILIEQETKRLVISDLGNKSNKSRAAEKARKGFPISYEYLSPEQSGLTGGAPDLRSDLYTLGVLLYELLTGRLPLNASSPAEWVRVQSSTKPENPDNINPNIPSPISAIVMKLLSTSVDERYQSVHGLIKDLEECREQWNAKGRIESFELGRMDVTPRFELPDRLIGREREISVLNSIFQKTCQGEGGFVLISGYAGTGKTMLINKAVRCLAMEKGYYGYGKFSRLRENIPYAPFADALRSIVKELITESGESLKKFGEQIMEAVGNNGAILTWMIPELEIIVGPQLPPLPLPPKESEHRFHDVLRRFIKLLAMRGMPLVIVLDDLQWADAAFIRLLRYLCLYTEMDNQLFIGIAREEEMADNQPLMAFYEELRHEGNLLSEISLASLTAKDVSEYVAATLQCSRERSKNLAQALYRKTLGNPLFLGQMLKSIHDEGLIRYNTYKDRWEWDEEPILNLEMPDDIVELINSKLGRFGSDTLNILKLASCMGNVFEADKLAACAEKSREEVLALIQPAIEAGLIFPSEPDNGRISGRIEFLHDRVAQSVYSMLSDEERRAAHVRIGRMFLNSAGEDRIEDEKLLSIVDHLNRGIDLIKDRGERLALAEYNLAAGRKAKASVAYNSAVSCFRAGMMLLPENAWRDHYRLCFDLHFECAQCEYITGNEDVAEGIFDEIMKKAETEYERADISGLKIVLYSGVGRYAEAINIGIKALRGLGLRLPSNPKIVHNGIELLKYKWYMRNRKIEELLTLPEMKSNLQRKVSDLLIKMILATCTDHPDLYSYIIILTGNHALKYGNTEMASIGYIGYGIVEGSVMGNYEAGNRFGRVSLTLADRYNQSFIKCVVYFTYGAIINHWTNHAAESLDYFNKQLDFSAEAGDVLVAGFSLGMIVETKFLIGRPLDEILTDAEEYGEYGERIKHENLIINAMTYRKATSVLTSDSFKRLFSEPYFNDEELEKLRNIDKSALAASYIVQMQLWYLAGDYEKALDFAEKLKECEGAIMGFLITADSCTLHSLTITAACQARPLKLCKKSRLLKELRRNRRRLAKWAKSCEANFLHKHLLVEAETARLKGKKEKAGWLYDRAIESAKKNCYVQYAAMACELAANFYLSEGRSRVAKAYLNEAYELYNEWGAKAKANEMIKRYSGLLEVESEGEGTAGIDSGSGLEKGGTHSGIGPYPRKIFELDPHGNGKIDLYPYKNAIKIMSDHLNVRSANGNSLKAIMECVCANRAHLLIEKDGELYIESSEGIEGGVKDQPRPISLESSDELPKTVVRYVARTLETVVINSEDQIGIFSKDPYIIKKAPKSIACIPLHHKKIPTGVLYLESTFLSGVFTEERIELLNLLGENIFYSNMLRMLIEEDGLRGRDEEDEELSEPLTDRETDVLKLIADGLSNKEVADYLDITENTVKTHIKNIYGKLHVSRRVQAVDKGKRLGII